ncbi:MAG: ferredoxin [Clostridiales bacterium]|nr:ferredoxin [Clostridiales bacterium]
MKAIVDQETCIGCGLCPSICEEVFQLGDDGKAHAIVDEVPSSKEDEAKDAELSCPVSAISCE